MMSQSPSKGQMEGLWQRPGRTVVQKGQGAREVEVWESGCFPCEFEKRDLHKSREMKDFRAVFHETNGIFWTWIFINPKQFFPTRENVGMVTS